MKQLIIIKASGEEEPYDERKVRQSLVRSGASQEMQNEVLKSLESKLKDGMTTRQLYVIVRNQLKRSEPKTACNYNLKQALLDIGTTGYPFEQFLAGVLRAHGFEAKTNIMIQGKCIQHEIDVIALKDDKRFMVEAKYHGRAGVKTDAQVSLYTYARFLDVQKDFGEGWLVTNTKATTDAIDFGKCAGLRIISWGYPVKGNLQDLIESTGQHPITCLVNLSRYDKEQLLLNEIVFCKDLLENDLRTISHKAKVQYSKLLEAANVAKQLQNNN